ncbi:hypothetical protein DL96DRAFT_1634780 [Flagelloscypha sp. PMI_526]|nr:hypothetical protein DL96DRAFT_1634780 [Flagelloscypha sp. PMI_526]
MARLTFILAVVAFAGMASAGIVGLISPSWSVPESESYLQIAREEKQPVLVTKKLVHKVVDEAPFIIDEVVTVTWTQEPTATASATPRK